MIEDIAKKDSELVSVQRTGRSPTVRLKKWSRTVHVHATKRWLDAIVPTDIDRSWSENVAKACNGVDYGTTDPSDFTSRYAQSWHFNTNDSCGQDIRDSRIQLAVQQLKVALNAARNGLLSEECYNELGRGLHPLQDSFAHSDEFITKATDGIFVEYYTHATRRGWHADDIYVHEEDDEDGNVKSVAETKTSPVEYDNPKQIVYDLLLMSELPDNKEPKPNKIYFEKQSNNSLKYIVLSPEGQKVEGELENILTRTGIENINKEFLVSKKFDILNITSARGHTQQRYNGRYALSRLATWLYVGIWAYAAYKKWNNVQALEIANNAIQWIGKDASMWYAEKTSKNALFYLGGFIQSIADIKDDEYKDLIGFLNLNVVIQGDAIKIKDLTKGTSAPERSKVLHKEKGLFWLAKEAIHYKHCHLDSPDVFQIDALNELLASKEGIRSIKIACGNNQWLGVNKNGWAVSVSGEDNAVELAFVEIENGVFNIFVVSDKKDELYYALGCNSNGCVGVWPANKVYPWQILLEDDGKIRITSAGWGNCCKMIRCNGLFYVLDENKMKQYLDENIFGFELRIGRNISSIMSLRIVNDIKLSCGSGKFIGIDNKGYANTVNDIKDAEPLRLIEIGPNKYSILVGNIGNTSKCYQVLDCRRIDGCVGIYEYGTTNPWWVSFNSNASTVELGSDYWGKEYKMMRWNDYFYVDRISKLKSYRDHNTFVFKFVEVDGSQLVESKEAILTGNMIMVDRVRDLPRNCL